MSCAPTLLTDGLQLTVHRAALCHPMLQPSSQQDRGAHTPVWANSPSSSFKAAPCISVPSKSHPWGCTPPPALQCTGSARELLSSSGQPSIFLHSTTSHSADKLHGPQGPQHGGEVGGRYVGQDLLQPTCCHLMQSLQPQDLSTAVQHHPPTHNPQPTELQPPAGPASPPHRQCVISPPHPLRLCLKQHLATTLGRSRRAGSYQSCLQPPLLSVSVQHGQGGCRARTKLGTAPRPDPASPAASRQAGNGRSPGPPRVLPAPPRSGCRRAAPLPAPACSDAGGSSQEPLGAGSAASQGRQRRGPRAARRRGGGFSLPTGSAQLGHAAALTAPARMGNGERSLPPQPSRFPRWHRGHAVGERSPSRQPMCAPRLILIEGDKRRRTEEVALLTTVRSR